MIDFKLLVKTIKNEVFKRGYTVDEGALTQKLMEDEKRLRLYKSVFATDDGRWVLTDLMTEGGLLTSHEADDPLKLARLEGRRSMAIHIVSSLGLTFEQVVRMYKEGM